LSQSKHTSYSISFEAAGAEHAILKRIESTSMSYSWMMIVGALSGSASGLVVRARRRVTRGDARDSLRIKCVEWQSKERVLISWSDPTVGMREDQAWRACRARKAGICVLTGCDVRPGDSIFRPIRRDAGFPTRASVMILADRLPPADVSSMP
jgi:hypothetical protein